MPAHKIPVGHLHEDLIALEREGETAKTVTRDGAYYIVTTEYHNGVETRPALRDLTHPARLGIDPLLEAFIADDIVRGGA